MSTPPVPPLIADTAQRDHALRAAESCIVQAPAGSGKTELLTQRYLALLPTVEEPEQVLALTFTRKATAEMRARILKALEAAALPAPDDLSDHAHHTRQLASVVLEHSGAQGWRLLEQPQRLNLQTIDALALSIAYQTPLLSRLGGQLTPVDDAGPLYAEAAERTLNRLGDPKTPQLTAALQTMLALRDANLADCEALLARMLGRREQWLLLIPDLTSAHADHERLRALLEAPFRREQNTVLTSLQQTFAGHAERVRDLLALAAIARENGQEQLAALAGVDGLEGLRTIELWQCFASLLINKKGDEWVVRTSSVGLPLKTYRVPGELLQGHIAALREDASLLPLLSRLRHLPPVSYTASEWDTVDSVFTVLRYATAELRVLFAERETIDFAEASLGAHLALHDPAVLMRLDTQVRHLLVDEFQDTSRPQFALMRRMLDDWQPGDGRTVFLVGDPMQSIYLFRDAEPRLFQQVRSHGMEIAGAYARPTDLQLATNFRSTPAVVRELNEIFERVMTGSHEDDVRYAPAAPAKTGDCDESAVHVHVRSYPKDADDSAERDAAEAEDMMAVLHAHLPQVAAAARDGGEYRIAVLARSRSHLVQILDRLRREGIPFRGVKLDLLRDRQEILDLLSLLRAMLHPADTIAWLAVLRAPWCGLTLPSLHALHGDLARQREQPVASLLRERLPLLAPEDQQRALHVWTALDAAAAAYTSGALATSPASLALLVERTWQALGAPRYLDPEARVNTEAFFRMLAEMPPHSLGTLEESFRLRLENLYAEPDPNASEKHGVQVMTIHSAKGLEFEVVLVPALHKTGKADDPSLFQWLVREQGDGPEEELLLAPIGAKMGDKPPLYQWISRMVLRRQREEDKRLLYVACSRTIRELHLFTSVERKKDGEMCSPPAGTLLKAGWPGLEERVLRALEAPPSPSPARVVVMEPASGANPHGGLVTNIAAAAPRQVLHRVPASAIPHREPPPAPGPPHQAAPAGAAGGGGRRARIQGMVLHALLERAARGASGARPDWSHLARLLLRQHGLSSSETAEALRVVLSGVQQALADPQGQWLLDTRHTAWNESAWTSLGEASGRLLRQRPDRVFVAGPAPGEAGFTYLWIVDYKTGAPAPGEEPAAFVAAAREQHRDQLEQYSELFRKALLPAGERLQHRLALYHPLLPALDWWVA